MGYREGNSKDGVGEEMKITFLNYWEGNSMKDGGAFPITLIEFFADIHPSFKYVEFAFLNFSITIEFGERK